MMPLTVRPPAGGDPVKGRSVRTFAVLCTAALVVAACSKPAKKVAKSATQATLAPVASSTSTSAAPTPAAAAAAAAAKGAAKAVVGTTTHSSLPFGAPVNESYARALGDKIFPQSTQRVRPYYSGVGEDSIQLDFSYDATSCGVNVVNAITAAGGALPTTSRYYRAAPTTQSQVISDTKEGIAQMVQFWNDHAFDVAGYLPHIRPLMGNDAHNQFFGRHLNYKLIDGGSNQCPDKTRAAAIQAGDQDHAFSVFNDFSADSVNNTTAYNMAADLNSAIPANRRPMHFGELWEPDSTMANWAPFAWTQFATGSTIVRQLASYVCGNLVGKPASRSPNDEAHGGYSHTKRVFGLVHTDVPDAVGLANEFKGQLDKFGCGHGVITKEIAYNGTDFAKAQQDNANLVLQLQLAGVTSVIMLTEPVQPLLQLNQANQQNYHPEWIWSSYGYDDSSTVQRLYMNNGNENAGSFGTSNLGVPGGFGFGAGDPFYMYHAYHTKDPATGWTCDPTSDNGMSNGGKEDAFCKAPTAIVTYYYTMLPMIGGMFFAGPDLTPQHVTAGLQAFPSTRYGGNGPTDDPRPALVGAGPGKYGFVVDSVEWRWRPDYTSPPPEKKAQWTEYPDCQRHYVNWPNDLALNWHPNEPAFGAWCGDPKTGYPRTLPDDGNH